MNLFLISMTVAGTDEIRYMYNDRDCGYGFSPSPDKSIKGAMLFNTFEEAEKVYRRILEAKPMAYHDGTIFPPTDIHNGLGICIDRPTACGELRIEKVQTLAVIGSPVSGEIKKPKGFIY
jgi:hypothetical protein